MGLGWYRQVAAFLHYTTYLQASDHWCTKMSSSDPGFKAACEEAEKSLAEGGIPIGACLVSRDGKIMGRGHNLRVQRQSATLHVSHCQRRISCIPIPSTL